MTERQAERWRQRAEAQDQTLSEFLRLAAEASMLRPVVTSTRVQPAEARPERSPWGSPGPGPRGQSTEVLVVPATGETAALLRAMEEEDRRRATVLVETETETETDAEEEAKAPEPEAPRRRSTRRIRPGS